MRLHDLKWADQGDYGWCIYDGEDGPRLVYYDDDDFWCSHGHDERDPDHECPTVLGEEDFDPKAPCYLDNGALILTSEDAFDTVPFVCLRMFEASVFARSPSTREGWIYAVALMPEVDLRRIKVGYSARSPAARVASFRITNPTALIVGVWDADPADERRAHRALGGRIGKSEVFHVADVYGALRTIDRLMGACE